MNIKIKNVILLSYIGILSVSFLATSSVWSIGFEDMPIDALAEVYKYLDPGGFRNALSLNRGLRNRNLLAAGLIADRRADTTQKTYLSVYQFQERFNSSVALASLAQPEIRSSLG